MPGIEISGPGKCGKGKTMRSSFIETQKTAPKLVKLALAVMLPAVFLAGHTEAKAAKNFAAKRFGPVDNGIVTLARSSHKAYSRGVALYQKTAKHKHAATRQIQRRKAAHSARLLKGIKRAFVGAYPPGSSLSPAPVFSRATLDSTRSAITRYAAIVRAGGWRRIARGKPMKRGDIGERVAQVKQRLMRTGDFRLARTISNAFDADLVSAVKRFQRRHGLGVDGAIGKKTLAAMNVSAARRLGQLRLNLARLEKKLRSRLPERFVMVNIPDYRAEIVEKNKVRARHNVVVGRASRQTNIITARITQTNFYPYWHVPQSIVVKDLLPRLRRGENLLARMRMRVSHTWGGRALDPSRIDWSSPKAASLKFRQEPGVNNALGMLRINMPNRHAIYLHDTPTQNLLARKTRAYSSGCVRVKDVFKLAKWLLEKNAGWDQQRIEATVRAGKPKTVTLKTPVPVYFDYVTAWAAPDGVVQFRRDIYGRDGGRKIAANF